MRTRIITTIVFGAMGSVLLGAPGCGTDETSGHPSILGDAGTGGSSGTGGRASTGGSGGVAVGPIGKACKDDSDCVTKGLVCVPATSNLLGGTGPAGGICTIDCSDGDDSTCQAVDPNAVCVAFDAEDTQAYCLETCAIGDTAVGETKCHNRKDMACDPNGFCDPICRNDADCGDRKCDPGTGRCVDKLPVGDPTGTRCDPQATTNTCAGICIPLDTGIGACAQICTLGQAGCGFDPNSNAPIDAFCAFVSDQTESDGDLGFCGQLCDCNADCRAPGFVCSALPSAFVQQIGRAGNCVPPMVDPDTGVKDTGIACSARPDAGVDAGVDAGAGGTDGGAGGSGGTAGTAGDAGAGGASGGAPALDAGADAH